MKNLSIYVHFSIYQILSNNSPPPEFSATLPAMGGNNLCRNWCLSVHLYSVFTIYGNFESLSLYIAV